MALAITLALITKERALALTFWAFPRGLTMFAILLGIAFVRQDGAIQDTLVLLCAKIIFVTGKQTHD